jgi:hypothetical protein
MDTKNRALWELLDKKRRGLQRYTILDILKNAKAEGIVVSFDDLRMLALLDGPRTGTIIQPERVTDFIISYFKNSGLKSVLDCWAGIGAVLSPLVQTYKPAVAIGLNQVTTEHEVARLMDPKDFISWQLGESLKLLNKIRTPFDAVIGFPPFGLRQISYSFRIDKQEVELTDDYASLLLLRGSLLLKDSGSALFVLPPKFLIDRGEGRVISNLARFGLGIDAILHLPSGTFAPVTQISGLLVIVRCETKPNLFVGEITADPNQRNILLSNLNARKEGKSPPLGLLVEMESFRSFPALVAEYETNSLARMLGLPPIKLLDICTSISLPSRKPDAEFVDLPNSVYLPTIGNSPAVASLAELKIKPQNYIQLVVNPDKAFASYLAQFLNTSLGRKIREGLVSGFIPKITKYNLSDAIVFLPERGVQIEVISAQAAITDFSTKLETLSRELWNHPRKYKEVQKLVKSMQPSNDFKQWIDSLPFPISSILWTYHADADVEHKVEHLLLFFEAVSEFVAVLMLSAYAGDKDFYAQESGAWIDNDPKYKDWVLTSTFGGWRILGERLAKVTRTLQEDKEKRDICAKLFGNPSAEFLSMLTDKRLFTILRDANVYRDQWKGHSGAPSYHESQEHLALLESNLSEVRRLMQDRWEDALLLSAGSNEYSDGIFEYQVKALMGTRTPFKEMTVKTLTPMDRNKIYILHTQQQRPTEILPFIRLMESPKTQANAIYFYNRMVGDKVRWLSYHFDKESEIIRLDREVSSAIRLLQPPVDGVKQ